MLAIDTVHNENFWVPTKLTKDLSGDYKPFNRHLVGFFMYGSDNFIGVVRFKNAATGSTLMEFDVAKATDETIYIGLKMDLTLSTTNDSTRFLFSAVGYTGGFIGVFA